MATAPDASGKRQKTGGRKKGSPNKLTAVVKDAILNAFQEVGGKSYLVRVAEEDPRAFCTLLGKILPSELNATVDLFAEVRQVERRIVQTDAAAE